MNFPLKILPLIILFVVASSAVAKRPQPPPPESTNLQNVITVSAENGDYTNPEEALNSIVGADENNRFVVLLGPGVYDVPNNLFVLPYVHLQGMGQNVTKISCIGNEVCISPHDNSEISNLTVENINNNGTYSYAILNQGTSPRMQNIKAIAIGGIQYNTAIANYNCSSTIMTNVTAEAHGGLGQNNAIENNGCVYVRMTNIIAKASGGSSATAITNVLCESVEMDNLTAEAYDADQNYGVANLFDSSVLMKNSTATASGGSMSNALMNENATMVLMNVIAKATGSSGWHSVGMYNYSTSIATIQGSYFEGDYAGIWIEDGADMRIVNTQIVGGVDDRSEDTQCRGTYDETLANIGC